MIDAPTLARLRALHEQATAGPWIAENAAAEPYRAWGVSQAAEDGLCVVEHDFVSQPNAELIAELRNALPDILESLAALPPVARTPQEPLEARRIAAYRQARVFEPSMDGYRGAMSVYLAAFPEAERDGFKFTSGPVIDRAPVADQTHAPMGSPDLQQTTVGRPTCALCAGPHPYDTSIPSTLWNRVIRANGLPDYLCMTCIVAAFEKAGESFTAVLSGDDLHGVMIHVEVGSGPVLCRDCKQDILAAVGRETPPQEEK